MASRIINWITRTHDAIKNGVIGETYRMTEDAAEDAMRMYDTSESLTKSKSISKTEAQKSRGRQARYEYRFNLVMAGVIILNIFMIAIEMDWGPATEAPLEDRVGWILLDCIFTIIFVIECCVRLHWERWKWPRSPWNWFDVFIVISSLIDVFILSFASGQQGLQMLTVLRIARLLRLIRMVKLVRALQGVYVMALAMWHAMKAMCFICSVMVFGVLLYAIVATNMIGRSSAFDGVRIYDDTVDERFGTVFRSMYSLLELMTLEGWDQVARPLVETQPLTIIFIGSFIVIFTFGMLNMIVALVVEKTMEQTRHLSELRELQTNQKMRLELSQVIGLFHSADDNSDGGLSFSELSHALEKNVVVRRHLRNMGVPVENAKELFNVLDWDSSGVIQVKEFVSGIAKTQAELPSGWDATLVYSFTRAMVQRMSKLQAHAKIMEERVQNQDKLLQKLMAGVQSLRPGKEGEEGPPFYQ